jgi:predicted RNase H-like nuclease (RuvC/YqgF family)
MCKMIPAYKEEVKITVVEAAKPEGSLDEQVRQLHEQVRRLTETVNYMERERQRLKSELETIKSKINRE